MDKIKVKYLRRLILLSSIVFILGILLIIVCYFPKKVESISTTPYIEQIDSLQNVINSLELKKDSIKVEIDTVYLKIEVNNKHYEETRNTILNNDINEDLLFFTEYIRKQQSRFDSINNV